MHKILSSQHPNMANSRKIREVWFYSNLAFIVNYFLTYVRMFVSIPLPHFPSFFNSLCLLVSYGVTIMDILRSIGSPGFSFKKVYTNQNLICIGLFLCFVPNILLLPFFLLSVYHVNADILSRKQEFERYFFFDFCILLGRSSSCIGRTAIYLEVLLVPVSFIMVLFRMLGFVPFVVYCGIVRQQYINNRSMKSVVEEIVLRVDDLVSRMPKWMSTHYATFKGIASKYNKPEEPPSKRE